MYSIRVNIDMHKCCLTLYTTRDWLLPHLRLPLVSTPHACPSGPKTSHKVQNTTGALGRLLEYIVPRVSKLLASQVACYLPYVPICPLESDYSDSATQPPPLYPPNINPPDKFFSCLKQDGLGIRPEARKCR